MATHNQETDDIAKRFASVVWRLMGGTIQQRKNENLNTHCE
jgi:hypothetical protein